MAISPYVVYGYEPTLPLGLAMQSLVSIKVEATNSFVSYHSTWFDDLKATLGKTNAAIITQADCNWWEIMFE